MSDCERLYWRLSQHHDGELESTDCEAIERHLQECAVCGAIRQDLEDLARLCREAARPRLPDAVRQRVQALLAG